MWGEECGRGLHRPGPPQTCSGEQAFVAPTRGRYWGLEIPGPPVSPVSPAGAPGACHCAHESLLSLPLAADPRWVWDPSVPLPWG